MHAGTYPACFKGSSALHGPDVAQVLYAFNHDLPGKLKGNFTDSQLKY